MLFVLEPGTLMDFKTVVEPLEEIFGQMKQAHLTALSMAFLKPRNSDYKMSGYLTVFRRVKFTLITQ